MGHYGPGFLQEGSREPREQTRTEEFNHRAHGGGENRKARQEHAKIARFSIFFSLCPLRKLRVLCGKFFILLLRDLRVLCGSFFSILTFFPIGG
jgi:hypothetical protein